MSGLPTQVRIKDLTRRLLIKLVGWLVAGKLEPWKDYSGLKFYIEGPRLKLMMVYIFFIMTRFLFGGPGGAYSAFTFSTSLKKFHRPFWP